MKQHFFDPNSLYGLRYAGYHPSDAHAAEIACVILTETWLHRVNGEQQRRELETWVRNNRDIMDAYVRSVSVGDRNYTLFEGLEYPCEHCTKVTTLRNAHLVSLDSSGLPNHEGFPKYVCADCAQKTTGENI